MNLFRRLVGLQRRESSAVVVRLGLAGGFSRVVMGACVLTMQSHCIAGAEGRPLAPCGSAIGSRWAIEKLCLSSESIVPDAVRSRGVVVAVMQRPFEDDCCVALELRPTMDGSRHYVAVVRTAERRLDDVLLKRKQTNLTAVTIPVSTNSVDVPLQQARRIVNAWCQAVDMVRYPKEKDAVPVPDGISIMFLARSEPRGTFRCGQFYSGMESAVGECMAQVVLAMRDVCLSHGDRDLAWTNLMDSVGELELLLHVGSTGGCH